LTTGNDSLDFKIVRYSKNKINGNSVEYYENGSISKGKYQDDRKVGQWTLYGKDKKTIIKKLYYTEGFLSRIEIIEDGKVVKQAITDPPF
jgi:antitoxin component YwqK of YwqJK toxin-antitoxin module